MSMNNKAPRGRGRPRERGGNVYERKGTSVLWVRYRDAAGGVVRESAGTADRDEADRFLRGRLNARDDGSLDLLLEGKKLTFSQWADWFLEHRSKPPFRSEATHRHNVRVLKTRLIPAFGSALLSEITTEAIESYIEERLQAKRTVRYKLGNGWARRSLGIVKPATVHQEFRILRRILNVAVKKRKLSANPCNGVEFPVSVKNSIRKPRYLPWSEQERVEMVAPSYLRHVVIIMTEMGLRPYKELLAMRREQVDLENRIVHIPDSKTEAGVADMPMTDRVAEAFRERLAETPPDCPWLFPTPVEGSKKPYLQSLKRIWESTLSRAKVPYFALYELRHTFATRLSAGGVGDHWVSQMLRQGDAEVFKRYSQAKLGMMREALAKLDRQANEHHILSTASTN